jgi:serine/threonine-protein kinase
VDASEPRLDDLAGAILDGTAVDWQTIEASATESERPLLEELRVLARLAEVHRAERGSEEPVPRPTTWGHLRVLESIGSGAFGHVYRAWDSRLDREVALKLLPAQSDVGAARASSIIHEGRLLARVRHPNVVTIHGAERIGDIIGLWMERIDGETVEQRLARESPFRPSEAIRIALQICHAVAAVHKAGLVHRDIKTQNVMLASDGRAVLMDFGTGWEVGDASASGRSSAGTPLYLAPEVLRGGVATIESDVYSLGVVLYRMLTGTYPVCARSLSELRSAHDRRERGQAVGARHHIPRRLARIITRAIDSRPERRYDSVDALAGALVALEPRASRVPLEYAIAVGVAVALAGWWAADRRMRQESIPPPSQPAASPTAAAAPRAGAPAIAVLPLKNSSVESGSDDFADGFTAEIISNLANEHLQVRSRASSFALRGNGNSLQDIARQLNASVIVEGSIQRSGERVQVEARLVDARRGLTLWNERFDTTTRDLVTVRNRITRGIVNSLGLTPAPARRVYEVNPDTYGRYLTARALVSRQRGSAGVQSTQKAVEYFRQVIAADPAFAPAYAGLADAYAYMSLPTYQGMPVREAQGLMRTAALKALELDPDLSEAHAAMGVVHARHLDWQASQHDFERAIALNPSLSQVYTSYSFFTLRPLRRFEEAERLLNIARQADPLSLDVWREMATVYFTVGRYDEAIDLLERVRAVDPQLSDAAVVLARALACRGRTEEALALYDTYDRAVAGVPHYRAYAYVKAGRRSDAERLATENSQYPYRATIIYAALGDLDRAFDALAQTAEREPQRVPLLLTWPEMARLRSDPRFSAVQTRFGLP